MKLVAIIFSILMVLPAQAGMFPKTAIRGNAQLHKSVIPGVVSTTGIKPLHALVPNHIRQSIFSAGREATVKGRAAGAGIRAAKIENRDHSTIEVLVTPYVRSGEKIRRQIIISTENMDVKQNTEILELFRHSEGDVLKTIYTQSSDPKKIVFEVDYGSKIYNRQVDLISRIVVARNEAHLSEIFQRMSVPVQKIRPTTSK